MNFKNVVLGAAGAAAMFGSAHAGASKIPEIVPHAVPVRAGEHPFTHTAAAVTFKGIFPDKSAVELVCGYKAGDAGDVPDNDMMSYTTKEHSNGEIIRVVKAADRYIIEKINDQAADVESFSAAGAITPVAAHCTINDTYDLSNCVTAKTFVSRGTFLGNEPYYARDCATLIGYGPINASLVNGEAQSAPLRPGAQDSWVQRFMAQDSQIRATIASAPTPAPQ